MGRHRGVDWNGLRRGTQFGEFWPADGWDDSGRDADHVTLEKTLRHSLARIREFWNAHHVWPGSISQDEGLDIEYEGPRPADLERAACTEWGRTSGDPAVIPSSPNTVPGLSEDTAATSATFHIDTGTTSMIDGGQSVYLPPA